MIWLLGLLLAAVAVANRWDGYPIGEGPFDRMPSGTGEVIDAHQVVSTDGRPYMVTAYRRVAHSQIYYVAVRSDNSHDWISYLFNPSTKARLLYRANAATVDGIADLKKDFGL